MQHIYITSTNIEVIILQQTQSFQNKDFKDYFFSKKGTAWAAGVHIYDLQFEIVAALQISDVLNTCCNFDVYYYIILLCYLIGIYDYETFLDINGADPWLR